MATPAQVANDLAAQAAWFHRRDDDIARLCRDSARLIRALVGGVEVDGRTFDGVLDRLHRFNGRPRTTVESVIDKSLLRAAVTIDALRAAGSDEADA